MRDFHFNSLYRKLHIQRIRVTIHLPGFHHTIVLPARLFPLTARLRRARMRYSLGKALQLVLCHITSHSYTLVAGRSTGMQHTCTSHLITFFPGELHCPVATPSLLLHSFRRCTTPHWFSQPATNSISSLPSHIMLYETRTMNW